MAPLPGALAYTIAPKALKLQLDLHDSPHLQSQLTLHKLLINVVQDRIQLGQWYCELKALGQAPATTEAADGTATGSNGKHFQHFADWQAKRLRLKAALQDADALASSLSDALSSHRAPPNLRELAALELQCTQLAAVVTAIEPVAAGTAGGRARPMSTGQGCMDLQQPTSSSTLQGTVALQEVGHASLATLLQERELLIKTLQEKDQRIEQLQESCRELQGMGKQLQLELQGAHTRYEEELQGGVAELQRQHVAALELLQLGQSSGVLQSASTMMSTSARATTGSRAACTSCAGETGSSGCCTGPGGVGFGSWQDALKGLGVNADDLSPLGMFAEATGLRSQPLADLRNALNLGTAPRGGAASASGICGATGSTTVASQPQFEVRLRNTYRQLVMHMRQQHEEESSRSKAAYQTQLKAQEERHQQAVAHLRATHASEMQAAQQRMQEDGARHKAKLHRLETLLLEATGTCEALRGELQQQQAAMQELKQQRADIDVRLAQALQAKVEYEAALQQRERDFNGLMQELQAVRRQLSSSTPASTGSSSASSAKMLQQQTGGMPAGPFNAAASGVSLLGLAQAEAVTPLPQHSWQQHLAQAPAPDRMPPAAVASGAALERKANMQASPSFGERGSSIYELSEDTPAGRPPMPSAQHAARAAPAVSPESVRINNLVDALLGRSTPAQGASLPQRPASPKPGQLLANDTANGGTAERHVRICAQSPHTRSCSTSPRGAEVAVAAAPRCLRCGQTQQQSPNCCSFHPGLLAEPGSLMFTPEWHACKAAGHTASMAGCCQRKEHFFAPLTRPSGGRASGSCPGPLSAQCPAAAERMGSSLGTYSPRPQSKLHVGTVLGASSAGRSPSPKPRSRPPAPSFR